MLTAIEHGSVGPKRMAKAISESKTVFDMSNKLCLCSQSCLKVKEQKVCACVVWRIHGGVQHGQTLQRVAVLCVSQSGVKAPQPCKPFQDLDEQGCILQTYTKISPYDSKGNKVNIP